MNYSNTFGKFVDFNKYMIKSVIINNRETKMLLIQNFKFSVCVFKNLYLTYFTYFQSKQVESQIYINTRHL